MTDILLIVNEETDDWVFTVDGRYSGFYTFEDSGSFTTMFQAASAALVAAGQPFRLYVKRLGESFWGEELDPDAFGARVRELLDVNPELLEEGKIERSLDDILAPSWVIRGASYQAALSCSERGGRSIQQTQ